jgi:signal transduction histidine kinase
VARAGATRAARAHLRLQRLFEISTLLTRFVSAGRTLADVVRIVGEEIPLATALLLVQGPQGLGVMLWSAEGLGADRPGAAEEHARLRYADLVGASGEAGPEGAPVLMGVLPGGDPSLRARSGEAASRRFVVLPLVVERRPVFGALQLESVGPLDELDLAFVSSVVNQLAVALDRQALLDAQQRASELFMGMLGHDLRNPLGAIVLGVTLLLERDDVPAEDERVLRLVLSMAERMGRMIEQILDFTRGRLGGGIPIVRARVDACQLVRRAVDEVVLAHPDRAFDLVMPSACEGDWDPDRLAQVVSNVVGNAVHHGRKDRPIRIRVAREAEVVVIAIQNDGEPIPEALLPFLFDPFRRGAPEGSKRLGLGLGLYITERIVEAHGGTIRVRSTADEGTTFTVTLPVEASPAPASQG